MTPVKTYLRTLENEADVEQIPWTIMLFFARQLRSVLGSESEDFGELIDDALARGVIPRNVHCQLAFVIELTSKHAVSQRAAEVDAQEFLIVGSQATLIDKLRSIGRNLACTMFDRGDCFVPQANDVQPWRTSAVPQRALPTTPDVESHDVHKG